MPRAGDDADDRPRTAIIADPRNDQTEIILQLHVAMQKFHNRLVDVLRMQQVPRSAVFESARRLARWHYQWIVIHEFLPAIVGQTMSDSVYKEGSKAPTINIKYYKPTNPAGRSFIPVEFAVAAYRFGHSITRPRYTVRDVFDSAGTLLGSVSGVPLFAGHGHRQQLERAPRVAASAEDSVEQVLQRRGAEAHSPARAPVRHFTGQSAVQAAPDGAARQPTLSVCCRSGISSGAGRWACPQDSRWLG